MSDPQIDALRAQLLSRLRSDDFGRRRRGIDTRKSDWK
jgi:hypothetical protein